ncbi:hypothetical protein ADUPG1_014630 [Aduncisulcus paluster]|uniref:Uncharacterized protein n=1 Tax=Aduncisulcus paluster TaxID=2918883 RepID=A0ABQ5JT61_9EUKA|nr:hypothetical protein ADUPG1_014630 [Aduncisulcus paluster]
MWNFPIDEKKNIIFSESTAHKARSGVFSLSHSGSFVAHVESGRQITIRSTKSPFPIKLAICVIGDVKMIEWSKDDNQLLYIAEESSEITTIPKTNVIHLHSVETDTELFRLSDPVAGISHAFLDPSGTRICVVSEFCLEVAVWFPGYSKPILTSPTPTSTNACAFNSTGTRLCVVERHDGHDFLCVFSLPATGSPEHAIEDQIADSSDSNRLFRVSVPFSQSTINGCMFHDDENITMWDCPTSLRIASFNGQTGECIATVDRSSELGVSCIAVAPSQDAVAFGTYGGIVLVLSPTFLAEIAVLYHTDAQPSCRLFYQEKSGTLKSIATPFSLSKRREGGDAETEVPTVVKPPKISTLSRITTPVTDGIIGSAGVRQLCWSPSSERIVSLSHDAPSVVWEWDVKRFELKKVIQHESLILGVKYLLSSLFIVQARHVYAWNRDSYRKIDVKAEHNPTWGTGRGERDTLKAQTLKRGCEVSFVQGEESAIGVQCGKDYFWIGSVYEK